MQMHNACIGINVCEYGLHACMHASKYCMYRHKSSVECNKVVSAFLVILWEQQFCAQISFVFHCFLTFVLSIKM